MKKTTDRLLEEALIHIDELNEKLDSIKTKTKITKESLEKYGMKTTNYPAVPMLKVLGEGSAGMITIGVSRYRNADEITMSVDGGIFYLNVECIEDLEKLESMIQSYESNF